MSPRAQRWLIGAAAGAAAFLASLHHGEARERHHRHHHRHHHHVRHHDGRPGAWCGWFLARHFGLSDRRLWLAREWARFPRTSPHVGAVAVWPHHVGVIVGGTNGHWIILSGNDGHRVRTRERSVAHAIAFVQPPMRTGAL